MTRVVYLHPDLRLHQVRGTHLQPLLEFAGDEFARQFHRPARIGARGAIRHVTRREHVAGAGGLHALDPPRRGNADDGVLGVDVAPFRSVGDQDLGHAQFLGRRLVERAVGDDDRLVLRELEDADVAEQLRQIGRASCRERVFVGV